MPTAQQYVDEALRMRIPMETIERFLSDNPGDYHRLATALAEEGTNGAPDEFVRAQVRQQYGYTNGFNYATVERARATNGNGDSFGRLNYATFDPELIGSIQDDSPGGGMLVDPTTSLSIGGVIRTIGGVVEKLPIPGAGTVGGAIKGVGGLFGGGQGLQQPRPSPPRLPLPPGPGGRAPAPPPPRPVGSGVSAGILGRLGRLSPYINPKTGKQIPWKKIAKISAAAAALGIGLEEYIEQYGVPRDPPTMNPLNPRALKRAINRADRFACYAKRIVRIQPQFRSSGRRGCRKKKVCR